MQGNLFTSNFKYILKKVIAGLLLLLTVSFVFYKFTEIVKYPRHNFYDFYGYMEKDTIDVLCVGSSHVYCSINPVQMYDDYGIAAFNLAAGSQSVWYSYYYIKEALKTQKPKIIILDIYTVISEDNYFDYTKTQGNLLNMKPSYNKWEALKAAETDKKVELFLGFPITHTRYNNLQKRDFDLSKNGNGNFLGYYYSSRIVPYEESSIKDVGAVAERTPITEKAETYIRKCIELCQEKDIEIILTNAPWPNITEETQKRFNYVQDIADEYQVPFINGCLHTQDIGLDYAVDSMGDGGHLNYTGAVKYTKWLSDYLKSNYDLPDRRTDERYRVYQEQSDKLAAVIRRENIKEAKSIEEIFECLEDGKNLYYTISFNGNYETENTEVLDALSVRGFDTNKNGSYVMNGKNNLFYSDGKTGYEYYKYINDSVLYVYEEDNNHIVNWDSKGYVIVRNGVNIVIYDELLDEIVGKIGFDGDNNYELTK